MSAIPEDESCVLDLDLQDYYAELDVDQTVPPGKPLTLSFQRTICQKVLVARVLRVRFSRG